ncbi:MAG: Gfo/Idh/MocA family oxidoreductase [Euryarchaeota archaeon]|nr:Gfo/Idh/MocA family oxidoreductase [Euryarchaeota archaeon]
MVLTLGIIGLSDENGHPYSWSAIINGYNYEEMRRCEFPVIPEYLEKQKYPEDFISGAQVTHIWTQDLALSQKISACSKIPYIVQHMEDLIGKVDGVLLARDDAENHYSMAKPFIEAGLPIYIDKPLSLSVEEAKKIFNLQKYPGQIFSCSALAYSKEIEGITPISMIHGEVPKYWDTYAIHVIDPALRIAGKMADKITYFEKNKSFISVTWSSGLITSFVATGKSFGEIYLIVDGVKITFQDTFYAFKHALLAFIQSIKNRTTPIPSELTLKGIDIIERGKIT